MVELCVVVYEPNINCPIEFPFNVSLSTADGTAGMFYCATAHTCITMHLGYYRV